MKVASLVSLTKDVQHIVSARFFARCRRLRRRSQFSSQLGTTNEEKIKSWLNSSCVSPCDVTHLYFFHLKIKNNNSKHLFTCHDCLVCRKEKKRGEKTGGKKPKFKWEIISRSFFVLCPLYALTPSNCPSNHDVQLCQCEKR